MGKGAGVVKEGFPEEVTVKQRQNTSLAVIQQSMCESGTGGGTDENFQGEGIASAPIYALEYELEESSKLGELRSPWG